MEDKKNNTEQTHTGARAAKSATGNTRGRGAQAGHRAAQAGSTTGAGSTRHGPYLWGRQLVGMGVKYHTSTLAKFLARNTILMVLETIVP